MTPYIFKILYLIFSLKYLFIRKNEFVSRDFKIRWLVLCTLGCIIGNSCNLRIEQSKISWLLVRYSIPSLTTTSSVAVARCVACGSGTRTRRPRRFLGNANKECRQARIPAASEMSWSAWSGGKKASIKKERGVGWGWEEIAYAIA